MRLVGILAMGGCGLLVAAAAVTFGLGALLLASGLVLLASAGIVWTHAPTADTPLSAPEPEPLPAAVIPPRNDAARLAANRETPPGIVGAVHAPRTINTGRHGA